jgi:hypothetical protein
VADQVGELAGDAVEGDLAGDDGRAHAERVGVAAQLVGPAGRFDIPGLVGVAGAEHPNDDLVAVHPLDDVPQLSGVVGGDGVAR